MITAIIPTRDDDSLSRTVQTLGGKCEILVIDDASVRPVSTGGHGGHVRVIRNEHPVGPAVSRHIGAEEAETEWLMFSDSHMIYPSDWYDIAMDYIKDALESEIWGPIYRQNIIADPFWHDTRLIGGADFFFWRHKDGTFSFCDLVPRRIKHRTDWDVPCLLGGCYFINKRWFLRMGGFQYMTGYGSEEPWLSWNTWLKGGYVKIMGKLIVTHLWQKGKDQHRSMIPAWELNRLVILKRILKREEFAEFITFLPIDGTLLNDVIMRCDGMCAENDALSHNDVCHCFGLQDYGDAIELMRGYWKEIKERCPVCGGRCWLYDGNVGIHPCSRCNRTGSIKPNYVNHSFKVTGL